MSPFTISPILRTYLEKLKQPDFEDSIPYMYVDSVGKITVGVGHNLSAHRDHESLAFVVKRFDRHHVIGGDVGIPIPKEFRTLNRAATRSEIKNDFDFLHAHVGLKKYSPSNLEKYTTLEIPLSEINRVFENDLKTHIDVARREFGAAFEKFPIPCQAALIDFAFNAGSFRLFKRAFLPAVKGEGAYAGKPESERWKAAAAASPRAWVQSSRNLEVARWLNVGADEALNRRIAGP